MCHSYEAVYTGEKGRPLYVLPVVDFQGGIARVCIGTGEVISVQEHDMEHFTGVRPAGNTS